MSGIARTRTEIACFNPHRIITIIIVVVVVVVVVVMLSVKVYLAMYSEYMCESGERRIRVNYEPCTWYLLYHYDSVVDFDWFLVRLLLPAIRQAARR